MQAEETTSSRLDLLFLRLFIYRGSGVVLLFCFRSGSFVYIQLSVGTINHFDDLHFRPKANIILSSFFSLQLSVKDIQDYTYDMNISQKQCLTQILSNKNMKTEAKKEKGFRKTESNQEFAPIIMWKKYFISLNFRQKTF